ncbi:MAG TPA: winged helix-turn-helix domain-containing protein [Candidatus Hydrogenedens sp.]|nr:restriction endonuclease [Candidatus Hydrogenedens sp.]HOK09475.1 winged helix-turn-helix domain-containing protein [Candidatus Hydrogenedens sp.]HOL20822.1 winged helix-turn-helix domain-containing protein [Candidatus Hydrogenedens sp.]HPP59184.1 winged helix-turn-helix domain-containing protein [Candidatus Hydrogenedens sp.]
MIPETEEILLPLLKTLSDGKEWTAGELENELANYFGLTEEEKKRTFPGKRQKVFYFRVYWATTYLKIAKFVDSQRRNKIGYRWITEKGREILSQNPEKMDTAYLVEHSPEFAYWKENAKKLKMQKRRGIQPDGIPKRKPKETIMKIVKKFVAKTEKDLGEALANITPTIFGKLIIDILNNIGYKGVCEEIGRTSDKEEVVVDGIIKQGENEIVYLQARYGRKRLIDKGEIEKFAKSINEKQGKAGVFITTSFISREAWKYVDTIENPTLIVIDRQKLVENMLKYKIGISVEETYEIIKMDANYFAEPIFAM